MREDRNQKSEIRNQRTEDSRLRRGYGEPGRAEDRKGGVVIGA